MKNAIWLGLILCLVSAEVYAKPSSSSRPSSSSAKPSGGSKPSFSKPSSPSIKPSSPSFKPSSPSSSSKPATPTTGSSRPNTSHNSSTPSTKPTVPSFSSRPESKKTEDKSITNGSSRPNAPVSSTATATPSTKPKSVTFDSAASNAQKKAESKTIYKAATTPKETYTTSTGKAVKIDPKETSVSTIRNTVTPEKYAQRSTRVEHHYHNYYGNRYDYYRSQPYIDIGGGYNYLFWYAMMDWSAQRRAEWLYHNQSRINSDVYQQQLQNAELRAEIEKLKARNVAVNPQYVDAEFKDNPDLMYSDEYVNAVYNPTPVAHVVTNRSTSNTWTYVLISFVVVGLTVAGLYYVVFVHQFKG